jgi:hypothetical protein
MKSETAREAYPPPQLQFKGCFVIYLHAKKIFNEKFSGNRKS